MAPQGKVVLDFFFLPYATFDVSRSLLEMSFLKKSLGLTDRVWYAGVAHRSSRLFVVNDVDMLVHCNYKLPEKHLKGPEREGIRCCL